MKKKIYISLSADNLHHGHINVINKASSLGDLTVGLLTDKAVLSKKRLPNLNFSQRKKIILNIKGIKNVVAQNEWDDTINIKKLRPDIVVHGDDWKYGVEKDLRKKVIACLKKYGGKLVEIPHEKNATSFNIHNENLMNNNLLYSFTPDMRRSSLKQLLNLKSFNFYGSTLTSKCFTNRKVINKK